MDHPTKTEAALPPIPMNNVENGPPLPTYGEAVQNGAKQIAQVPPAHLHGPAGQPVYMDSSVTPLEHLTPESKFIDCPFCHRRTQVQMQKEGTAMQTVAGVVCCLFCLCLACVPCLAGWFENENYVCTGCHKKVATRFYDSGTMTVYGQTAQSAYQQAPLPHQPMQPQQPMPPQQPVQHQQQMQSQPPVPPH
ncbi:hypothetical protein GQ53DRAFT_740787 [Thozetella sp. PMI_491]|nr:hypothetical protein GQ53DRAFT_740787 [Thozetella sp. PMI_491]